MNTPAQKTKAVLRPTKGVQAAPKLLTRIESLRLLSKVENAGLLSFGTPLCPPCLRPPYGSRTALVADTPTPSALTAFSCLPSAESAGLSLSSVESLGLLSKAESLGALSFATDRGSPSKLAVLGLVLLVAAAGVVAALPDTDSTLVALQAAGAALLSIAGLGALLGGSFLGSLQK